MSASPHQGDDTAARIGERLASLRADRGLRVAELARRTGVSPSLVSQIERGQSRPSVTMLVALADGVGAPIDALFREAAPIASVAAGDEREEHAAAEGAAAPARPGEDRFVVRRGQRAAIEIEGGVRWERLTPATLDGADVIELVYAPRRSRTRRPTATPRASSSSSSSAAPSSSRSTASRTSCTEDDSMQFPSSAEHRYVNPTD